MMENAMKCNTCMALFPSLEVIKDHYRGEWHCLNSKRRAQNMPPLKRDQFVQLVKASVIQKPAPAVPTSSSKMNGKIMSKPDNKALRTAMAAATISSTASVASTNKPTSAEPKKDLDNNVEVEKTEENAEEGDNEAEEDDDEAWEDMDDEDDEEDESDEAIVAKKRKEVKLGAHISLFDDKVCANAEECAKDMASKHGFFIPDAEYLADLTGLLDYLGEKVKLGNLCLYCQKAFPGVRACQNHMISTSHCKLRYEEGVDLEEYEDFYDFSTMYEHEGDEEDEGQPGDEEAVVIGTGELQLPDGRLLGHRQYRQYYKQHYRAEDTRAPIVAQQKEELLRLGNQLYGQQGGAHGEALQSMQSLSEAQVMTLLIQYQKQLRKSQVLEQRCAVRQQARDQRREYKSNLNKVRSSETTTAKIRDYHGMLK